MLRIVRAQLAIIALFMSVHAMAAPIGSAFTYQGSLAEAGAGVDDNCDFHFSIWDAASAGTEVALPVDVLNHPVSEGIFTVELDFGFSPFLGEATWLEIAVACPTGAGLTTLTPRQALTPTPQAFYAQDAGSVSWSGLIDIPPDIADGDDVVNGGNSHDHFGGDGGQIGHGTLLGLTSGDPHTQYLERSGDSMTGTLNMGGNTISNLAEPVASSDASTKAYVQSSVAPLQRRVDGTCSVGSSIRAIAEDGTVTCDALTLPPSIVLDDGELLDLSAINASSDTEGLILPQATNVTAAVSEGQISWDSDDDVLYVGTGTIAQAIKPNLNIQTSTNTSPVFVACPTGQVVGGGCSSNGFALETSCPAANGLACSTSPNGWLCTNTGAAQTVSAFVVCLE